MGIDRERNKGLQEEWAVQKIAPRGRHPHYLTDIDVWVSFLERFKGEDGTCVGESALGSSNIALHKLSKVTVMLREHFIVVCTQGQRESY